MPSHRWEPVCRPPPRAGRPGAGRSPPESTARRAGRRAVPAGGVRAGASTSRPAAADLPEQRILEQSMRLPAVGAVTGWAACRLHGAAFFDGLAPDGVTPLPVPLAVGPGGCIRASRRGAADVRPPPCPRRRTPPGHPGGRRHAGGVRRRPAGGRRPRGGGGHRHGDRRSHHVGGAGRGVHPAAPRPGHHRHRPGAGGIAPGPRAELVAQRVPLAADGRDRCRAAPPGAELSGPRPPRHPARHRRSAGPRGRPGHRVRRCRPPRPGPAHPGRGQGRGVPKPRPGGHQGHRHRPA